MTSDTNDRDQREDIVTAEPAPESAPEADAIAKLEADNADLKDRIVRTLAEMENLRKRTEREVVDARTYAVTAFARDLVGVADNLDRALSALPEMEEGNAALTSLVEGVALTSRELSSTFAKHGIARIEPKPGDKFDPNLHEALFEVPDPSLPSGSVVQTVQAGFTIANRLLRPAKVGVSKGGVKAAPARAEPPVEGTP